jgi:hypothetical protein
MLGKKLRGECGYLVEFFLPQHATIGNAVWAGFAPVQTDDHSVRPHDVEGSARPANSVQTLAPNTIGIPEISEDCVCDRRWRIGVNQRPRVPVEDNIRQPPDASGDDRRSAHHSFYGDNAELLPERRHNHNARSRKQFRQGAGVDAAPDEEPSCTMKQCRLWTGRHEFDHESRFIITAARDPNHELSIEGAVR